MDHFESLLFELECYQSGMTSRPSVIAANKMDLPRSRENLGYFLEYVKRKKLDIPVFPISGNSGEGLEDLVLCLRNKALGEPNYHQYSRTNQ